MPSRIVHLRDDRHFLRLTSFEGDLLCSRLKFIFNVVHEGCAYNMNLAARIWLHLIEGPNNIWLWRDGDEEGMRAMDLSAAVDFVQEDWLYAQVALKKRLERTSEAYDGGASLTHNQIRRLRDAPDPCFRFVAIAWLILTSEAMQDADAQRGLRDRETYSLGSLVETWWRSFPQELQDVFQSHCDSSVYEWFAALMAATGHTCHLHMNGHDGFPGLKQWLYFVSWMDEMPKIEPMYFNRNECQQCHLSFLHSAAGSEVDPDAHSSEQLHVQRWQVWTAFIMAEFSEDDRNLPEDFSPVLKSVDECIKDKLDRHIWEYWEGQLWQYLAVCPPDARYSWWINAYPAKWRNALTRLSPEDWQSIHDVKLGSSSSAEADPDSASSQTNAVTVFPSNIDIRTLISAILWLLLQDSSASHGTHWEQWAACCSKLDDVFINLPKVPQTSSISTFCDDLRTSGHTCYFTEGQDIVQLYASMLHFLHSNNNFGIEALQVGRDTSYEDITCPACLAIQYGRSLSDDLWKDTFRATSHPHDTLHKLPIPLKPSIDILNQAFIVSQEELEWYSSIITLYQWGSGSLYRQEWREDWSEFFECIAKFRPKIYQKSALVVIQSLPIVWSQPLSWERMKHIEKSLNGLQHNLANLEGMDMIMTLASSQILRDRLLECWKSININHNQLDRQALETAKKQDEKEILRQLEIIIKTKSAFILDLQKSHAQVFIDLIQYYVNNASRNHQYSLIFDQWIASAIPSSTYSNLRAKGHRLLVRLSEKNGSIPQTCYVTAIQVKNNSQPVNAGGFADILQGRLHNHVVALKRLRLFANGMTFDQKTEMKQLCREALIWKQMIHQNILPFFGVDCKTFPNQWCLISLWMDHGDILNYLRHRQPPADGFVLNNLLYEISQGLAYLHWENIVHGDLKGANILIDNYHHVRLADFGLAVFAETTNGYATSTGQQGSTAWMAPELHQPKMFGLDHYQRTRSSDIYAYGCVCLEIYTGHPPFAGINDGAIILEVIKGVRPGRPSKEACDGRVISNELWNLIERCWDETPFERPDIREIASILARSLGPLTDKVNDEILKMLENIGASFPAAQKSNRRLFEVIDDLDFEVIQWPQDIPTTHDYRIGVNGLVGLRRKHAYSLYNALTWENVNNRLQFCPCGPSYKSTSLKRKA